MNKMRHKKEQLSNSSFLSRFASTYHLKISAVFCIRLNQPFVSYIAEGEQLRDPYSCSESYCTMQIPDALYFRFLVSTHLFSVVVLFWTEIQGRQMSGSPFSGNLGLSYTRGASLHFRHSPPKYVDSYVTRCGDRPLLKCKMFF